ncbi:MAG: polyribonucleotide nucleotidyltransferase [Deltaproteobacteria bacterium]|nr:polyribonucleotide nucleotidyltransferase [Deltaproteobacteria bacterium]
MSIIRESVEIGNVTVTLETGRLARQAHGSVLVSAGETMVLVTACGNTEERPGVDFFPLTCDYIEKTFAAGKIPGGFFKREGRPRDEEVLTSRLIDRPCRPLFPEGYKCDTQVIATVLSADRVNPSDVLALTGASCALHLSDVPWSGPIAGVRVGRVDGQLIANPTFQELERSDLEIVVAASRDAIVMVEGGADEVTEDDLIDALMFAHRSVQGVLDLQERLREAVGKAKRAFTAKLPSEAMAHRVREVAAPGLQEAMRLRVKGTRYARFKALQKSTVEALRGEFPEQDALLKLAFHDAQAHAIRTMVTDEGVRIDGRDTVTVRPITCEVSWLPRTHGSALFTRGETQGVVTTTLGTAQDEQKIDGLVGERWKRFLLHYNFPPYSVGEVKPMRSPGRREVGHGNLAERALLRMMPTKEQFPYTVRVVSEVTESNGSSSMATVCGGTLSLMDAGVPIKAPVAGVAMGLIKEGDKVAVLTDILGDEDHLGDMDFKVCGTRKGVTAIQMDIKIDGLSREILDKALRQARDARLHILDRMLATLPATRTELSKHAPRITTIKVNPSQVRLVIGPGGKTIKGIVDQTGVAIDIEDDGSINLASSDNAAVQRAIDIIRGLTAEAEVGAVYKGTVKRLMDFGAFVEIFPGTEGLVHVSELAHRHVQNVGDVVKEGDEVEVKVLSVEEGTGKIRLSRRAVLPLPEGDEGMVAKERMERAHADGPPPSSRSRGGDRGDRRGGDRDRGRR